MEDEIRQDTSAAYGGNTLYIERVTLQCKAQCTLHMYAPVYRNATSIRLCDIPSIPAHSILGILDGNTSLLMPLHPMCVTPGFYTKDL